MSLTNVASALMKSVSQIPLEVGRRFSGPVRTESDLGNVIKKENRRGETLSHHREGVAREG